MNVIFNYFLGILVNLSFISISVYCYQTVKNCSTNNIDNSNCPINSRCLQIFMNSFRGTCECFEPDNYHFNIFYESDADYCILWQGDEAELYANLLHPPPNAHHIVGGILIPIFVVVIIIAVVYGTIRYRVAQRIREAVMSRFFVRQRPSYQDVMMGTDDDPPLI